MKASYAWLRELTGIDASSADYAERLTRAGVEVEGIQAFGRDLERIVVAEVRGKCPHPTKDKLTLVQVWDGQIEREIVCGAPNVPTNGYAVALAQSGAKLPGGLEIAPREVAGVPSDGMLCSESELGIGEDGDGILVMGSVASGARPGTPIAEALKLRDDIFEISLTPNRPDCLGHIGLGRELALLFGRPFAPHLLRKPQLVVSYEHSGDGPFLKLIDPEAAHPGDTLNLIEPKEGAAIFAPIQIEDAQRCSRYLGLVLQRVRPKRSPFWMRYRLHLLGQRSINSVVDATNWVLLETGHPVHTFDLDKLSGPRVIVRTAKAGEHLTTLDGLDRALSTDDLVIADAEKPLAIAGVMGGRDSGVSDETRNVLLEVAWFDPRSVRRTSRRHGLHSDASHRFERGCDPGGLPAVLRRTATLLSVVADAACCPVAYDAVARVVAPKAIAMRPSHMDELLGGPVPPNEARRVLEGVGCSIAPGEEDGWRVTAPSYRPDLTRPEDLIEEVARVRGYDLIPTEFTTLQARAEGQAPRFVVRQALRRAALSAGLFETVNLAFVSPQDLENTRVSTEAVALANPLSDKRSVMRTSLLPSLLTNLTNSQRHQTTRVLIFEIGRTYHPAPAQVRPAETNTLAILLAGSRERWLADREAFDFYDGKGVLGAILRDIGIEAEWTREAEVPSWLHPQRSARIVGADGKALGVLGEVHPHVARAVDVVGRPIYGELDVDRVIELYLQRTPAKVRSLAKFPAVTRDLSWVLDESVSASRVIASIRAVAPIAETVDIFDVYRGKPVPDGKKSMTFRIAYRDPAATLSEARVEKLHTAVLETVGREFGAALRA